MLQTLRGTVGSWFIKILLALIIVSFGVWGIGDIFRNRGADLTIARVEGNTLGPDQLRTMVDREVQRIQRMYQGQVDVTDNPDLRQALAQNSVQQWLTEKLYGAEAGKLGLAVSEAILKEHLAKDPAFQDPETKKFSPTLFRNLLQQNNMTEAQYLALIKRDLVNSQLAWALGSSIPVPQVMQKLQAKYDQETRDALVMDIPYAQFNRFAKLVGKDKIGNPTDAELRALIDANKADFSTPEYRALRVLWLSPDKIAATITIDEATLKAAYDNDAAIYSTPERRSLTQAVFSSEADAKKARALIDSEKTSLASAAKTVAKLDTVELSNITAAELPESLRASVFALNKGEISQPLQSPLGWHVLQLQNVAAPVTKEFAAVKAELKQKLALEKANEELYKLSDQLQDSLAGGQDFDAVAKSMPVKVFTTAMIARDGKNKDGKTVDLPLPQSKDTLLTVAFNTEPGKSSAISEAKEGGLFVVKVDSVQSPELKDFATVRNQALRRFEEQDMAANAGLIAAKLSESVKSGKSLAELATTYDLKTRTLSNATRDGKTGGNIAQSLFAASKGELVNTPTADGLSVAVVTAIHAGREQNTGLAAIANTLRREIAGDISSQLQAALTQRFDVNVNQSALQSLY